MALPVIRGSSAANYPFTMTFSYLTGISQWQSGSQQRWIRIPSAIVSVELPYSNLTKTQKDSVKSAVSSAKGRFDNTLQISLPFSGSLATFFNFGLDSDEWTATEGRTTIYGGPVKLTQSITQSLSPGSPGGAFPSLASAPGILPYLQKKRYQTVAQKVEAGPNYTYAEFTGGLANYPTDGLMAWEWQESMLSDADAVTRIAHFVANYGRAFGFSFTDPDDGTTYTKTHYASDDLAVTFRGVNDASMRIALEATF